MIELKITAETADELFEHLHGLASKNAPASLTIPARIDFAAAKAAQARVETYEPDAVDEEYVAINSEPAQDGEPSLDAAGEEWNRDIHSPNKTMTKDGRWRLKKGAVRPDVVPADEQPAPEPTAASPSDEEDEFAAFADAMKEAEPVEVEVAARTWTDADVSKLCNQAAQKMGGGESIKKIIAEYTAEGEVPHSRNVPVDKREDFAQKIEATAGIEYAG